MSTPIVDIMLKKIPNEISSQTSRLAGEEYRKRQDIIVDNLSFVLGLDADELNNRLNKIPTKRGRPNGKKILVLNKK